METILPAPDTLELLTLLAASQAITAVVRSRAEGSRCPMCHQLSTRVHSRYCRHLLDLPWQGVAMRIDLHVRRFFCDTPECIRQIFTERLSDIVTPYACRTKRLDAWFSLIGLALGGEAGTRLLRDLGLQSSPDTLLRGIRAISLPPPSAPRVVGVDDWSYRKGRTFGTIIVDLERRRVIDLLADRETPSVSAWFQQYPTLR